MSPAALLLLMSISAVAPAQVRDADDRMVANCEYLQDVQGTSGWGGAWGAGAGINGAKKSARKKAAQLGATHVVWGQITSKGTTHIQARAYRCSGSASDDLD